MKTYYTLLVRRDGDWMIEFGDWSLSSVIFEKDDIREYVRSADVKIVKTVGSDQNAIDNIVNTLNGV